MSQEGKGELYPREREVKRVHTLLTQRVTFVLRVIYVKSHSSGFGPQRVKADVIQNLDDDISDDLDFRDRTIQLPDEQLGIGHSTWGYIRL